MLTQPMLDPRAWQADTVDHPDTWYYPLSQRSLAALDQALREGQGTQPVTDLRAPAGLRATVEQGLEPVRTALEAGRGVAAITPGAPGRFAPRDLAAVYWLVGQVLGRPFQQNVQGTLLYDVRDTGQDD